MSTELHTAIHEAGHAVAHVVLRQPFQLVTIEPSSGMLGYVMPRRKRYVSDRSLRDAIVICFAGPCAESWLRGCSGDECGADTDMEKALVLLELLGKDQDEAFLDRAALSAHRIVGRHWDCIQAVARALVKHRTLTAREVRALIKSGSSTG